MYLIYLIYLIYHIYHIYHTYQGCFLPNPDISLLMVGSVSFDLRCASRQGGEDGAFAHIQELVRECGIKEVAREDIELKTILSEVPNITYDGLYRFKSGPTKFTRKSVS